MDINVIIGIIRLGIKFANYNGFFNGYEQMEQLSYTHYSVYDILSPK